MKGTTDSFPLNMNKESQVDVAQETIKMSYLDVLSFPNTPPKKESRTTLPKDDKKTILAFAIFTMVLLALVTIAVFTMMCLPKQKHYQTITKKANVVRGEKKFCSYYTCLHTTTTYMCIRLVKISIICSRVLQADIHQSKHVFDIS